MRDRVAKTVRRGSGQQRHPAQRRRTRRQQPDAAQARPERGASQALDPVLDVVGETLEAIAHVLGQCRDDVLAQAGMHRLRPCQGEGEVLGLVGQPDERAERATALGQLRCNACIAFSGCRRAKTVVCGSMCDPSWAVQYGVRRTGVGVKMPGEKSAASGRSSDRPSPGTAPSTSPTRADRRPLSSASRSAAPTVHPRAGGTRARAASSRARSVPAPSAPNGSRPPRRSSTRC